MHELFQLFDFNQLLQMVTESFAILGCMPTILKVLIVKTLIVFGGVASHFVWSFEVRLTFYLFKDLMHWLLEF